MVGSDWDGTCQQEGTIEVSGGYDRQGDPKVGLHVGPLTTQFTPDDARALAFSLIGASYGSERGAFALKVLAGQPGMDVDLASKIVNAAIVPDMVHKLITAATERLLKEAESAEEAELWAAGDDPPRRATIPLDGWDMCIGG